MDFGDKLKQYRLKEGLSQEQLAEKIGVSRQAITKWETKRGLPDVENMIILAEIFKLTLDELVLEEVKKQEEKPTVFESETVYDIDIQKHFDINIGGARTITLKTGADEKIHILLSSETLSELGSLFKVKLDEKKNKLDVELINKKGVSRFEAQESVDITLLLPERFTEHTEVSASVKELYLEDLRLSRLEYDGDAEKVYIRDTDGSLEFTSKTDYEIFVSGNCTNLDVNQFKAKTVVNLKNADNYKLLNNGRKCTLITRKNGETVEFSVNENAENTISISGLFSELIVEAEK
ncbi:MAG: helix-turn-helix transcriptional regulator [Clostridia bacterium]|nr:helix-turn-helix transcriptional regulator [Clostridia bacterium]MBR3595534.1 helix-turn-helix transcriptional regulator [Clostridia bacterium]